MYFKLCRSTLGVENSLNVQNASTNMSTHGINRNPITAGGLSKSNSHVLGTEAYAHSIGTTIGYVMVGSASPYVHDLFEYLTRYMIEKVL